MRWLLVVAVAGCGDSGPPVVDLANRETILQVGNAYLETSVGGPGELLVLVDLFDDGCTAIGPSFGGRFRGAEMKVRSYGGEQISDFRCNSPNLIIDPFAIDPQNETIEVYDDTATVSMTLPAEVLEPRTATAPGFDLHGGQALVVTWSHPADLINPVMTFRETFSDCSQGCFSLTFDTPGQVAGDQVTFVPSVERPANGEVFINPNFLGSFGVPSDCTADRCESYLDHGFLVGSNASP